MLSVQKIPTGYFIDSMMPCEDGQMGRFTKDCARRVPQDQELTAADTDIKEEPESRRLALNSAGRVFIVTSRQLRSWGWRRECLDQ